MAKIIEQVFLYPIKITEDSDAIILKQDRNGSYECGMNFTLVDCIDDLKELKENEK